MENIIQSVYNKIKVTENFHSIDKLDVEQRFDLMEFAIKSFEDYKFNLLEMANNGMISFEDYNNREQQPQFKQFENIAKESKNKYFEQLALEPKKDKQIETENYDIETVNNYNKILNCNYHLLNSLSASKLYDVLQYSRNKVSDIALNHNFLGKNKSLQIIQNTNIVYQGAKETHDIIEKKYNEINITQTTDPTPEPIEPEPLTGKITAGQKYYLLDKLGLFENGLLHGNKIKIEDKQLLVSKLLGVNIRTARAFMNNDEKYIYDPNKINDIDILLKKITKGKE